MRFISWQHILFEAMLKWGRQPVCRLECYIHCATNTMSARPKLTNPNLPLAVKLKRHLKYGDKFLCIFPTWDADKNQVVSRNKRHHKIVHLFHVSHFLSIWTQLYCTIAKATNFVETAEAIGFIAMTLGCVTLESELHPDSDQISLFNYICKRY